MLWYFIWPAPLPKYAHPSGTKTNFSHLWVNPDFQRKFFKTPYVPDGCIYRSTVLGREDQVPKVSFDIILSKKNSKKEANPDKKILQKNAKPLERISKLSDVIWCFIIWCNIDSFTPRFTDSSYDEFIDKLWIWFVSTTTNWLLKCRSSFMKMCSLELQNHFLGVRKSRTSMFYDILFVILDLETISKGFACFAYLNFSL